MILFYLLSFISPSWAIETTSNAIDISLADISRANLDAFSSTRYSAAVLPLIGRYQIAGAGLVKFQDTSFDDWRVNAAAIDSNTGPIAMGAFLQYSTGKDELEGSALPGWKLPEESLEREFSDLVVGGGGAVSFLNRKIGLGMNGAYYARTYITSTDEGTNQLVFWQEDTEVARIQQVELNGSIAGKLSDEFVLVGGVNDWLAVSDARYPYLSARFSAVDTPMRGAYRSYGGVEVDLETMISSDGFAFHYAGISGDIVIGSQFSLRGGYRYDFSEGKQVPGFGFGLDDGKISIDYGLGLAFGEQIEHRHALGLRFRL